MTQCWAQCGSAISGGALLCVHVQARVGGKALADQGTMEGTNAQQQHRQADKAQNKGSEQMHAGLPEQ